MKGVIHSFLEKNRYFLLLIVVSLLAYHRWLNFHTFTYSDWWFISIESMKELLVPTVWITPHNNFGSADLTLWRLPLYLAFGFFGNIGIGFNFADKILVMWPTMLIPGIGSFLLLKKVSGSELAAFVGSLVFSFNTYFLSINSQGHELLTIAFGFSVIAIWLWLESLEKSEFYLFLLTAFSLQIAIFYDFRAVYITTFILFSYFCYHAVFVNIDRKSLTKNTAFSFLMTIVLLSFNLYWLLPLFCSGSFAGNEILGRNLFGNEFYNLLRSFMLFHPFWNASEPEWFAVQPIPIHFFLIPFFAFSGLLLDNKSKYGLFFAAIALIGILLSKQVAYPFPNLYMWLYTHLPGFSAFREASKFYFLIALGYSVLISLFVKFITNYNYKERQKIFLKSAVICLISFLLLVNTLPLINGSIGSLFIPREIPEDYVKFNKYVSSQDEYFKILWTPTDSRWAKNTYNHPIISNSNIVESDWREVFDGEKKSDFERILYILKQHDSNRLLDSASIKYIVVPIQEKDYDDFYEYFGERYYFIKELDKLDYLERVDIGTEQLVIYKNEGYRPHIYFTMESETIAHEVPFSKVSYKFISPSQYKIHLNSLNATQHIIFTDAYDPGWKIGIGNGIVFDSTLKNENFLPDDYHSKTYSGFNSFSIDPDYIMANYQDSYYEQNENGSIDVELTLYFVPQNNLYLGSIFSLISLLICIWYVFTAMFSKHKYIIGED